MGALLGKEEVLIDLSRRAFCWLAAPAPVYSDMQIRFDGGFSLRTAPPCLIHNNNNMITD